MDEIQFVKGLQLQAIYYTLLIDFAFIALFKIPPKVPVCVLPVAKVAIIIVAVFSFGYQVHNAVALWEYRDMRRINLPYQKVLSFVYFAFFVALTVVGAILAWIMASQSSL